MHYVYILHLKKINKLYKGSTNNVKRRLSEHKNNKVKSTNKKGPIKLIHVECYILKVDAERREKFLKTTEGRRLLKQQLRDILQQNNYK